MRLDFALQKLAHKVLWMSGHLSYEPFSLPFKAPLRTAHGHWERREGFWLKWETATAVRYGEAAPVPGFGGMSLAAIKADLVRLGDSPSEAEWEAMVEQGGELGFALGSLRGDQQQLLAAGPDYIPVAGLLPAGRGALARIEAQLELGFRTFKWKVGVADPRDEQGMLDELLGRLPSGAKLRLDANGAWNRRVAERWLAVAAERPMIESVEQPVAAADVDLLLGLAGDYPVTLALDEAVLGPQEFRFWQDQGWPGVYVIKPALWGDPFRLVQALTDAPADVVISSALETRIGSGMVIAVAFALAGSSRAAGLGGWPLFADASHDGPTALPFLKRKTAIALGDAAVGETR